jgi:hypothetical protein
MTALNLAVVFGPTILKPREESLETAGNNDLINAVTEKLIQNCDVIFTGPPPAVSSSRTKSVNPEPMSPDAKKLNRRTMALPTPTLGEPPATVRPPPRALPDLQGVKLKPAESAESPKPAPARALPDISGVKLKPSNPNSLPAPILDNSELAAKLASRKSVLVPQGTHSSPNLVETAKQAPAPAQPLSAVKRTPTPGHRSLEYAPSYKH